MYSQLESIARNQIISSPRFQQILNAADPLFNPTSGSFIGQTTPYNPFGGVVIPSNLPLIDYATSRTKDLNTGKLATLDLNIYTTDLFDLPAGGVGLAFGGQFNRESYRIDPDDQDRLATIIGSSRQNPVKAGRKEMAFYGETLVPVFSPKFNIPGFYSLEFTAGVRYEDWFNNDTNAVVPKVGVRWQPFDESFTIRSTWGEGFLEPSMVQLFGPTRFLVGPIGGTTCAPVAKFGPCGSAGNPVQNIGNPEDTIEQLPNKALHPEHDRTWTGGFVYTPKWIPPKWGTLTLTVDFWDIERTGLDMYLNNSSIVQAYNAAGFPLSMAIISPAQPTLSSPASVLFTPDGSEAGVSSPYINGGRMRSNGVDLGLQYQIETGVGTFNLLSRWAYLNEMVIAFPNTRPREVAGMSSSEWFLGPFFGDITNPQAWLKWKGDTTLDWTWHNWDMNWTVHTLDGYWEITRTINSDGFFKRHRVSPTWFTDVQLSYSLIFTPPVEAAPVPGYSKGGKEVVGKEKEAPPTVGRPQLLTVCHAGRPS